MKRILNCQAIAIFIIVIGFLATQVECAHQTHKQVTLLTYYSDLIDSIMGIIEDISLDFIVPAYQYIKSHTALKYMFFTLLIMACVFNLLGNFNHLFKATKKAKFVANQDIPKDSKQFQKQIRLLRETVSQLKQQALSQTEANKTAVQSHVQVKQQGNIQNQGNTQPNQANTQVVQVQLDPVIDQRINRNQQSIDSLKQSLMKVVGIQQDLQNSILESQREVALNIQGIRTNKAVKKIGAPHSSQLDSSSQQRAPHSHSRQSSTSFLEESNENKLQQVPKQVAQKHQEKVLPNQQPPIVEDSQQQQPLDNTNPVYRSEEVQEKSQLNQNQQILPPSFIPANQHLPQMQNNSMPPPNLTQNEQVDQLIQDQPQFGSSDAQTGSAFGRAPPPTRPTHFGARQPPSLMNKKQPMRTNMTSNTPVVLPPKK